MIRCARDSFYTGITTDVGRRMTQHESGTGGSRYLRGRGPLQLVFECRIGSRSLASKVEYRIKKLPRADKERLARQPECIDELIGHCTDESLEARLQ